MSLLSNPLQAMKDWFGARGQGPDQQSQDPSQQQPQKQAPKSTQIAMGEAEKDAIVRYIVEQYENAQDDYNVLNRRRAWNERMRREKEGLSGGEEGKSNYLVQVVNSKVLTKHAREVDALFGSNPSIKATPRGPTDDKIAKRIGVFMTWAIYERMKAMKSFALWILRRLEHGRSFVEVNWVTKAYNRVKNGQRERVVYWSGPQLTTLNNDDIILPASVGGFTDFDSVQTAEWVIIRYWDTTSNMLLCSSEPGDEQPPEGDYYQGIHAIWKDLLQWAQDQFNRDDMKDQTRIESAQQQGVVQDFRPLNKVEILKCYIRWRRWRDEDGDTRTAMVDRSEPDVPAKSPGSDSQPSGRNTDDMGLAGQGEGREYRQQGAEAAELASPERVNDAEIFDDGTFLDADGHRKDMVESDLCIRIIKNRNIIVGIQDCAELTPDTPIKRPIFEAALQNNGQYWCQSLREMIEEAAAELTSAINQVVEATDASLGPPLVAEPSVGQNLADAKWEKNGIIWTTNANGVKQIQINPNIEPVSLLIQFFKSEIEDTTGLTNLVAGRAQDQPNAPRTLGGQRLQMSASDLRLALDMRLLSEDLEPILDYIFALYTMMGDEDEFFRVAEGDAQGLFDHESLENGWAKLTPKEREGQYDFSFKFADDMAVKEARKQESVSFTGALVQFPFIQQDMTAQYNLAKMMCDAFGQDIANISSAPPPQFLPKMPADEWNLLLERQDIHVHPADNDEMHVKDHESRIMAAMRKPEEDRRYDAIQKLFLHIEEHKQAAQSKQQMQQLMEGVNALAGAAKLGADGGHPNPLGELVGALSGGQPEGGNGGPPQMPGGMQ